MAIDKKIITKGFYWLTFMCITDTIAKIYHIALYDLICVILGSSVGLNRDTFGKFRDIRIVLWAD